MFINLKDIIMRLEGIEPPFQEPESYVRSITLQAQNNIKI